MGLDHSWLEENILKCVLSDDDKSALTTAFDVNEYAAGDVVVKEGQPGGMLYIVRSGSAEVTCHFNSAEVRVATSKEGSLFGEMTFLTEGATSATVTANNDCVIYQLSRSAYSEMMLNNQSLVYAFFVNILIHTANVIRHMNIDNAAMQQYIMGRKG